ncbi:hypothetical protein G6F57_017010 [Rhizopus arrhizus]|nr:hypothetical protein G6F57_017010 [Rhizopus arrhizus]
MRPATSGRNTTDSSERRLPTADRPRAKGISWTAATSTRTGLAGATCGLVTVWVVVAPGASQRGTKTPSAAPAANPAATAASSTAFFMRECGSGAARTVFPTWPNAAGTGMGKAL